MQFIIVVFCIDCPVPFASGKVTQCALWDTNWMCSKTKIKGSILSFPTDLWGFQSNRPFKTWTDINSLELNVHMLSETWLDCEYWSNIILYVLWWIIYKGLELQLGASDQGKQDCKLHLKRIGCWSVRLTPRLGTSCKYQKLSQRLFFTQCL